MNNFIEILKSCNFDEINKYKITAEDIQKFAICYQEIITLVSNYKNAISGRKEIAEDIRNRLEFINKFLYHLTGDINKLSSEFEYVERFISDYKMAMRLFLRLANVDSNNFILKKVSYTNLFSFERRYDDREPELTCDNVWIIGEKNALDNIDEEKIYFGSELASITNNILKQGHSLIVVTDSYYENNVKPWSYDCNKFQKINIGVSNLFSSISCYLYNDELKIAVNKFLKFIKENGADIKGIDEEELFNVINLGESSPKKLFIKKN